MGSFPVDFELAMPSILDCTGNDHAQAVSAHGVVQAAGDRASRFRANGRPRSHGRARRLDRDAAAGEESS